MSHILIVEDETVIRNALRRLLERHGYTISEAASIKDALQNHNFSHYQLIISDLRLPGGTGTDLIKPAGNTPVLIMTSYASLRSAVDAMKMGAIDYIAKPFDHDDMVESVARIIRDRAPKTDNSSLPGKSKNNGIIGSSDTMKALFERINKVSPTTATVLVQGETGTGKELVARAIHRQSDRANKPIISVNCAAIPESLIESELFGYEKGAFTGAAANRAGLIEAADGGTLFLDEIGELPLEAQARLLRFLQEGEIRAIGSVHTKKVDVRLIAATHRNLKEQSQRNLFREDLYYRIAVMQLSLPPLRERGKDILDIAESFLAEIGARLNRPEFHFTPQAIQAITNHRWPGNVRELQNAVERSVILAEGNEISHELLDIEPHKSSHQLAVDNYNTNIDMGQDASPSLGDPAEELSLEDYFQRFVLEHQDSMSETELARKLGVSRKCLWERRQRFGIPRKKSNKANS
jgi:DNA-binding NtrC family response regulator